MAITFVDQSLSYSSRVMNWYGRIHFETDSAGNRFNVVNPRLIGAGGRMSLENLLMAIRDAAGESPERVLVVCHGGPDGISIPLIARVNRPDRRAHRLHLGMLSGRYALNGQRVNPMIDDASVSRAPTDEELARLLNPITAAEIGRLRGLMREVQALPIRYLDFRACNLANAQPGGDQPLLREIALFFGIPHVCGPIVRDGFGPLDIEIVTNTQALSRRIGSRVNYPDLRPGHQREILVYVQRSGRRPLHALAGSRAHVARWMMQSFVAGNLDESAYHVAESAVPNEMNWHGFEASPDSPYHPSFVFPGMPAYHQHLRTHFESSLGP